MLADGATNTDIAAERKRFAQVLKACIQPILPAQAPAKPEPRKMAWQPASASDPAVWEGADARLQFRNRSMEEGRREVRLADGKRIYARLVPAEWTVPPRADFEPRVGGVGLVVRSRDGDWGLNSEGALSVWGRIDGERDAMQVWNATQWFRTTGEIWAINVNSFTEHRDQLWFSSGIPFRPLDEFLAKATAGIREMGGAGAEGTSEDWTAAERRELLRGFWNDLMDAYGEPPMSLPEFERAATFRRYCETLGRSSGSVSPRLFRLTQTRTFSGRLCFPVADARSDWLHRSSHGRVAHALQQEPIRER